MSGWHLNGDHRCCIRMPRQMLIHHSCQRPSCCRRRGCELIFHTPYTLGFLCVSYLVISIHMGPNFSNELDLCLGPHRNFEPAALISFALQRTLTTSHDLVRHVGICAGLLQQSQVRPVWFHPRPLSSS